LKIIAKINKLQHVLDYRKDPALNERMPGYQVKMGFGLHQGWAIEGAIGSMFKIDASYLSPNVNMASRLEAATKQYGVPLLISGALHDIFTDDIKLLCREIDTVTVKGSI
jgi:class 3 adenylate cyclase